MNFEFSCQIENKLRSLTVCEVWVNCQREDKLNSLKVCDELTVKWEQMTVKWEQTELIESLWILSWLSSEKPIIPWLWEELARQFHTFWMIWIINHEMAALWHMKSEASAGCTYIICIVNRWVMSYHIWSLNFEKEKIEMKVVNSAVKKSVQTKSVELCFKSNLWVKLQKVWMELMQIGSLLLLWHWDLPVDCRNCTKATFSFWLFLKLNNYLEIK